MPFNQQDCYHLYRTTSTENKSYQRCDNYTQISFAIEIAEEKDSLNNFISDGSKY